MSVECSLEFISALVSKFYCEVGKFPFLYLRLNSNLRLCGTLWSSILNGSCLGGRIILSLLFCGGDSSYEVEQCDKT